MAHFRSIWLSAFCRWLAHLQAACRAEISCLTHTAQAGAGSCVKAAHQGQSGRRWQCRGSRSMTPCGLSGRHLKASPSCLEHRDLNHGESRM